MKTKTVKTKDGEKIKLEIIEDFDNYRGFFIFYIMMGYIQKQATTALLLKTFKLDIQEGMN